MQASSQKGCSRKYVGHDKLSVVLLAHARQLLEKTDCCPQLFITVIAPGRHAGHFDAVLKDPEEFGGSVDRRRCSKVRRWRVNEIDEIRCIFPASREGRAGLRRPYRSSPDSPLEGTGFEPSVPPRKRRPSREAPRPTIVVSRDDLCLMTPPILSVRHLSSATAERPFTRAGPMVRIRFPPAGSPLQT